MIKDPLSLTGKKSILYGLGLGVFLASGYLLQSIGLMDTSSTHSAFITCTSVIFVPIILYLFFKQRIHKRGWICIVIVSIGLTTLTYHPSIAFNQGDILTFIAAIIYGWQIIYSGKWVKISHATSLIFYQFFFSSLISFLTMAGDHYFTESKLELSGNAIPAILYLGLLGTLFCYFFTVYSQKHVPTITVALIFALEPIFASTAAYFFLNERIGTIELIGAFFILIGLVFYDIQPKKILSVLKKKLLRP
ncbi:MAG TPA: EamA family transporter [Bacteroidetes bacterium]|nr:EamA family transporter [Bacteroidota bacterium]